MIIRSQDKKSITTDLNINIYEYDNGSAFEMINKSLTSLGTYSTEEKVIKVLDMIMEHYDKVMDARHWNDEYQENYFIMPSDEEVEV